MAEQRPLLPNSDDILEQLERKGVYFRDLEQASVHVAELAESLSHFPPHWPFTDRRVSLETLERQGIKTLSCADGSEMSKGLDAAARIKQERVLDPLGQPESAWMYFLNRPTLSAAFERSFDHGDLALMEDSLWTKGHHLQDNRIQAPPGFSNPSRILPSGSPSAEGTWTAVCSVLLPSKRSVMHSRLSFHLRTEEMGFAPCCLASSTRPNQTKADDMRSRRRLRSVQHEHWLCCRVSGSCQA